MRKTKSLFGNDSTLANVGAPDILHIDTIKRGNEMEVLLYNNLVSNLKKIS